MAGPQPTAGGGQPVDADGSSTPQLNEHTAPQPHHHHSNQDAAHNRHCNIFTAHTSDRITDQSNQDRGHP